MVKVIRYKVNRWKLWRFDWFLVVWFIIIICITKYSMILWSENNCQQC